MDFERYRHIERYGTEAAQGIELGTCYIFPKLDGTNSSIWENNQSVHGGSRSRELSLTNDNAGFLAWAKSQKNIKQFTKKYPNLRLFGEWLIPHSLKTYRKNAWRRFYVFDVEDENGTYLSYDEYKPLMEEFELDYIPPIKIITNAEYSDFVHQLKHNIFMIEDGKGEGEGIVIKNYSFVNKFGNQVYAKIVTSEFKEKHAKEMGAPVVVREDLVEDKIATEFVTIALCEKVYAKIENDGEGFSKKRIPEVLNMVYYDVIKEDSWEFVKQFNDPTINFKTLKHFIFCKVKDKLPEIFK
jgi:hypothetical protein